MLEYYLPIRTLHIVAVLVSGSMFFVRGLGLLFGQSWPKAPTVRYFTYLTDTTLLLAALALMVMLQAYPFVQSWLTTKVVCLVVYITLGIIAFRKSASRTRRAIFWLAALAVYAFIISVAQARHPLGFFASMVG